MVSIERVVNYLRQIGALDGTPKRELITGGEPVFSPIHPHWRMTQIDFHNIEFDAINNSLEEIDFDGVQEQALKEIPNSHSTTIIELGSNYGTFGAGYLARHKPNARVILVDRLLEDLDEPKFLFNPDLKKHRKLDHILIFNKGKELLSMQRSKERLKKIYEANGIENVEMHEIELNPENLQEFFKAIGVNGNVYLMGHKSPGRLGYTMAMAYNQLDARAMWVSLTSQEKIRPGYFPWKTVQKNLGLSDMELKGYITSVFDEKVADTFDISKKYDYRIPEEKRIAVMLKLGMAMALAREVNGTVRKNKEPNDSYNQVDHYVISRR